MSLKIYCVVDAADRVDVVPVLPPPQGQLVAPLQAEDPDGAIEEGRAIIDCKTHVLQKVLCELWTYIDTLYLCCSFSFPLVRT